MHVLPQVKLQISIPRHLVSIIITSVVYFSVGTIAVLRRRVSLWKRRILETPGTSSTAATVLTTIRRWSVWRIFIKGNVELCPFIFIQIRQKLKQNLRKQGPDAPLTSVATKGGLGQSSMTVTTATTDSPHVPDLSSNPVPQFHKLTTQKQHVSKHKEADRAPKRSSSEALLPSIKRKARRRKFSSSNESSTSEAPSNNSEMLPHDAHLPVSPMDMFSPASSHNKKEDPIQHGSLNNLDLLASVTQKIDVQMPTARSSSPLSPVSTSSGGLVQQAKSVERDKETSKGRKRKTSSAHSSSRGPPVSRYTLLLHLVASLYFPLLCL